MSKYWGLEYIGDVDDKLTNKEKIVIFEKALKEHPEDEVRIIEILFWFYFKEKRFDEAISNINHLIDISTNNRKHSEYYCRLGSIYNEIGNHKQALLEYNKMLVIDKNNSDAYYFIANTYKNKQNYILAEKYFRKAGKNKRFTKASTESLAEMFYEIKNFKKAKLYFKILFKIEDKLNVNYFYYYANIFLQENKYIIALNIYKKGIEQYPEESRFYYNSGTVCEKLNKFEEAEKFYLQSLEKDPDDYRSSINLSRIYVMGENNDYEKALKIIKKVNEAKLNENEKENYYYLTYLYYKNLNDIKNTEKYKKLAKKYMDRLPDEIKREIADIIITCEKYRKGNYIVYNGSVGE